MVSSTVIPGGRRHELRRPLRRHLRRLPRRRRASTTTATSSSRSTTTSSTPGSTAFENPFADLHGDLGKRNWDSDRRLRELEADGVVAEVIFPNTIPPFFPGGVARRRSRRRPTRGDLELRWAGLQAHNRWLADFCARTPGPARRHRADHAARRRRARSRRSAGRTTQRAHRRRSCCPARRPASGCRRCYAPDYEPIWSVCEELGMPVNHHGGSAAPDYGPGPRRTS